MQIRTIVVPIDFSPSAEDAKQWAIDLARRYGASLILAHVVPPVAWPASPDGLMLTPTDLAASTRGELESSLGQTCAAIREEGVPARPALLDGTPAQEIAALARRADADLIVMGTHGRKGVSHALLGSVAEKVLRTAPCPVFTVRMREDAR
ncbi:MAG TPA: universal stress protein [Kofleriaceae bacterium]|nr:universal stress protein [Kofleriaceae bacterium]